MTYSSFQKHFIGNVLDANTFPTLRKKKSAAFLAHIYRLSAAFPLPAWFLHEGAVLCLSSCFLPHLQLPSLIPLMSARKQNGEKKENSLIGKLSPSFSYKLVIIFFPPREGPSSWLYWCGTSLCYLHTPVCVCPHPSVVGRHAQFPTGGPSHKLLRKKCQLEGVVFVVSALRDGALSSCLKL